MYSAWNRLDLENTEVEAAAASVLLQNQYLVLMWLWPPMLTKLQFIAQYFVIHAGLLWNSFFNPILRKMEAHPCTHDTILAATGTTHLAITKLLSLEA